MCTINLLPVHYAGLLTGISKPDGTSLQFSYDADYHRTSKTITSGGVSHSVNDVYVLGHLAYQTDQNRTVLATFTYDSSGVPASVQVGSDPASAPRYYYVYNGHGDVVALVDAQGNVAASYSYDAFGQLTSFSENFGGTTTWTNPYLYDGRDGVRYDGETGLYWMSVRAYGPALGRFISLRDNSTASLGECASSLSEKTAWNSDTRRKKAAGWRADARLFAWTRKPPRPSVW